jgi:hypothetical protein
MYVLSVCQASCGLLLGCVEQGHCIGYSSTCGGCADLLQQLGPQHTA